MFWQLLCEQKKIYHKKIVTLVLSIMTASEMNGRRISSSGNVWYCGQTKSYWKLILWDISL